MTIQFDDVKHVNSSGGTQTKLPVRLDLIPADVLLQVAAVLHEGSEKYGDNNWKLIDISDHLNHALTHIMRYILGDTTEPHLVHAVCRLLFAAHLDLNDPIFLGDTNE